MRIAENAALRFDIERCAGDSRCGGRYPEEGCPLEAKHKIRAATSRGLFTMMKQILEGRLEPSKELAELFYQCTMCGQCEQRCEMMIGANMEIFQAFKADLVDLGLAPPKVRDFLENMTRQGNPWGLLRKKRANWLEGTRIKKYEQGDEYLFHVGCLGSYDPRCQGIVRTMGELFLECGIRFGVLGNEENCDGNDVRMMGEEGLFELLADKNIKKWSDLKVRKIVAYSPHAYNAIKNYYRTVGGGKFEVIHYTHLLWEVMESKKIALLDNVGKARVVYHDPCFLGRYNEIYDTPRNILRALPGIELMEMERNGENAFCCGGGGGNYYTGMQSEGGDGNSAANRIRIREAYETGAEILAVACPGCITMFEDAIKTEGLETKFKVQDISEIARERMPGQS